MKRILILGGGFGGVYTARHLERLLKRTADAEIVLVSRENFLLMTPLLFEVFSGTLDCRDCSFPIRSFLKTTRFIQATVESIDLERQTVLIARGDNRETLTYDHVVLALGAMTNQSLIHGSEHAFTFKTLADALLLRHHLIECFERADATADADQRRRLLTFAVIGGGLVGVELFGELTALVERIMPFYGHLRRDEVQLFLLQAVDRILPEIDPQLAKYGFQVLSNRRGAVIRTSASVRAIQPGRIHLADETIEADTIVLTAGILANPVIAGLPVEKGKGGHIVVDGCMRCPNRPEVWALGDCASVASTKGNPYPRLAQHALREAMALSHNIVRALNGQLPRPLVYRTLGMMGSLGRDKAFAQVLNIRLRGTLAWFVRRTYYLLQMPGIGRKLRIMTDWTLALLFPPEIVNISLDSERGTTIGSERAKNNAVLFDGHEPMNDQPADVGVLDSMLPG